MAYVHVHVYVYTCTCIWHMYMCMCMYMYILVHVYTCRYVGQVEMGRDVMPVHVGMYIHRYTIEFNAYGD
jgi:hypothetical protein